MQFAWLPSPERVRAILAEIYAEILSHQPHPYNHYIIIYTAVVLASSARAAFGPSRADPDASV